ncbi:class I adenylate-forming enzyme family protein [Rouxiella chamberiensis]|uniref:AMP-binding protein n=1 Tax=Rouxiella chamberiensis TaxID=1513468 RepID=A0ABY7HTU7_9GAMM|nr:AMP-binding protein [Rouxiella chamberiensis]WAT02648.1 AMP-binding protein [Rouxiella chamberiensis]
MPVHDKVKQHAETQGSRIAINMEGQTLNWQQLWQQSLSIFCAINDVLPVSPEPKASVIAVALGNDLAFAPAWLAATANTYTCAVIDPHLPGEQLSDVFGRLLPDLLLVRSSQTSLITLAKALNIAVLDVDNLSTEADNAARRQFIAQMDAATPFLVNFTSGTTSTPKAFSRSRHSWRVSFRNGRQIFDLASTSSTLFPGPLFHGIGLYCLNEALDAGHTFYCMQKWDAATALERLARDEITRLVLVPTMLSAFARLETASIGTVTHLLSAGAKLEMNHFRQAREIFPHAKIQEYYGASELGFIAVSSLTDQNVDAQIATVGLPFPEVSWSIHDREGNLLPNGTPGTIFLQSEQVCSGYLWGDDGQAFCNKPWGSTVHDMGYIDDAGRLVVIGRSGDMIVSGGNNIYLSEVESVIKSLAGITEAAVLAIDDDYRGKTLVAFIESPSLDVAQLPALCLARLAKYKLPSRFIPLTQWPLTPSGKIKRAVLGQRFINHEFE